MGRRKRTSVCFLVVVCGGALGLAHHDHILFYLEHTSKRVSGSEAPGKVGRQPNCLVGRWGGGGVFEPNSWCSHSFCWSSLPAAVSYRVRLGLVPDGAGPEKNLFGSYVQSGKKESFGLFG